MKAIKAKKAFSDLRLPARASLWYAAAALLGRLAGFVFTPVFTRVLSEAEYGVLPLYLGWMSVASAFATLEIGTGAIYGGFSRFSDRRQDFMKSALFSLLLVFLAFSLLFAMLLPRLSALTRLGRGLLLVMAAHIISDAICSLYLTGERYLYSYRSVFFFNVIPAVLTPLISLILVRVMPYYARPVSAALVSAAIAAVILNKWKLSSGSVRWEMVRYTLTACGALFPGALGAILLSNADKLLIGARLGTQAVAKYSVAHSLGLVLTFFTVGLYGALKPWIMRKLASGDTEAVKEATRKLLSVGAAATLMLTAIAPELISLLAPDNYADALIAVYPLAAAVLPMFLYNVFSSVLIFEDRGWLTSLFGIGAAGLNIALNILLLPRLSFVAASFAFLFSYTALATLGAMAVRRTGIYDKGVWYSLTLTLFGVFLLYALNRILPARALAFILLIPLGLWAARELLAAVREI